MAIALAKELLTSLLWAVAVRVSLRAVDRCGSLHHTIDTCIDTCHSSRAHCWLKLAKRVVVKGRRRGPHFVLLFTPFYFMSNAGLPLRDFGPFMRTPIRLAYRT